MAALAQSVWQLLSPMNEMRRPIFVKTGAGVGVEEGNGSGFVYFARSGGNEGRSDVGTPPSKPVWD